MVIINLDGVRAASEGGTLGCYLCFERALGSGGDWAVDDTTM